MPFSLCRTSSTSSRTWLGINVGSPIPRLTYMPSTNSSAARAAISSRFHGIDAGTSSSRCTGPCTHFLDAFVPCLLGSERDDALDENARRVHTVGVDLAGLHQVFDFGDGDPAAHRRQRVEVSRRAAKHQVAVAISLPRTDQTEIGDDRFFEDEFTITFAGREYPRRFGGGGLPDGAVAVVA